MLHELHVSDLGVIEDVDLPLDPGLNVLTGETGAGKTMITVALALALGRRASASLVRPGARAARVQARFDATPEAEEAGWAEEGSLVVARTIDADGRSSARAGGELVPISVLERLGEGLVELHGQHESISLRTQAAQTAFLDRYAGRAHGRALAEHAEAFRRLGAARAELDELVRGEREREREADVLAFQIGEIEEVAPRQGELEELEARALRLANVERLEGRAAEAEGAVSPDGGAAEGVALAAAALEEVAGLDPSASALAERARALREEVSELARDVRDLRAGLESDPAALDATNARIAAIRGLLRKYGETEEAVLQYLSGARRRASALESGDERRSRLRREVDRLSEEVSERAAGLSATRAAVAPRLSDAIERELRELGMDGASFRVELPAVDPTATGVERAEFVFAGGPRQRGQPLAKVASGGELSRAMLACRTVLLDADEVPTLVFDEVDAGIGGRAAAAVGRRLAALARGRQVLVVTHLPQIAAFADRHVALRKEAGTANAEAVDGHDRVAELSRMLAGLPESDAAIAHAEELLAEAGRLKDG
jgi:DNA repair protein RecN (Recombination protein N)